jgi:anti-anti-sigma factor
MSIGRHRMPSPPLDLTLSVMGDAVARLTMDGQLNAETVDELDQALHTILTEPGLTQLVLDFGPLTSIDSAGIATLVTAHQNTRRRGITLTVVNCGVAVRQALEVTGLYGHLTQGPKAPYRWPSGHGHAIPPANPPTVPPQRRPSRP